MRASHRRSMFGYHSKEVERHVASMKLHYEKMKNELETELVELKQMNQSMLEEIAFREKEFADQAEMGKELEGLLQKTHQEHSQQIKNEQPQHPFKMERIRANT